MVSTLQTGQTKYQIVTVLTDLFTWHIFHFEFKPDNLELKAYFASTTNKLDQVPIPAIVLYCATCRKIRNVIIAMVTPVVIKSYDK